MFSTQLTLVVVMKSDVLLLLSRGPKSKVELAAFFGTNKMDSVMEVINILKASGYVAVRGRRTQQSGKNRPFGNVVNFDCEYVLRMPASSVA